MIDQNCSPLHKKLSEFASRHPIDENQLRVLDVLIHEKSSMTIEELARIAMGGMAEDNADLECDEEAEERWSREGALALIGLVVPIMLSKNEG